MKKQAKNFAEWNEEMYEKHGRGMPYSHPNWLYRLLEEQRVKAILENAEGCESILDVGCGEGHLLARMRGKNVVGIDLSLAALKEAAKKTKRLLLRANAEKLPFQDNVFDAVVCSEVLEHLPSPKKAFSELARVAKPNGKIIVSIPNEKRINSVKDAVWKLKLNALLFPRIPKRMTGEWHLHEFGLQKLLETSKPLAPEKTIPIPPIAALRYVAVFRKLGKGKQNEFALACPDCKTRIEKNACKKCGKKFKKARITDFIAPHQNL